MHAVQVAKAVKLRKAKAVLVAPNIAAIEPELEQQQEGGSGGGGGGGEGAASEYPVSALLQASRLHSESRAGKQQLGEGTMGRGAGAW